jgi:hypothetical protein
MIIWHPNLLTLGMGCAIIFVIDATIGILDHRAFVYLPMCKPRPQICF